MLWSCEPGVLKVGGTCIDTCYLDFNIIGARLTDQRKLWLAQFRKAYLFQLNPTKSINIVYIGQNFSQAGILYCLVDYDKIIVKLGNSQFVASICDPHLSSISIFVIFRLLKRCRLYFSRNTDSRIGGTAKNLLDQ